MDPRNPPAASAAETAYEATRTLILDGDFPAGSMVSEGDVATRLDMSRTPVREAFLRLQAEGWLRLYPKRGALVVPPEPGESHDVLEARVLVETASVRHAVGSAPVSAALVRKLRALLDAQRAAHEAGDLKAFTENDLAFHRAIVAAGENAILTGFQDSLSDRERRMSTRSLWRRRDSSQLVLDQHSGLVDAISAGDPERFSALLRLHLSSVHRALLSF